MTANQNNIQKEITDYLSFYFDTTLSGATYEQLYYAIANTAKNLIFDRKLKRKRRKNEKTVHYLSIEFLIGKSLRNNLFNLKVEKEVSEFLASHKKSIDSVYAVEDDAALGNGGLGRLAACYLESLSRLDYSAMGHSIKYEHGLFKQKIIDGKQVVFPDSWLDTGSVWLNPRYDEIQTVEIGGRIIEHFTYEKGLSFELQGTTKIKAVPYDMFVTAYGSNNINTLRLWEAQSQDGIDLHLFELGEYESSLLNQTKISAINKILYPNDNCERGKDLRLIQQYFLVSAVMQSILKNYFKNNSDLSNLPNLVCVHINDTHPALCIPELMRLLIDKYHFGWEDSYRAVKEIISYTNHTILSESLEVKRMQTIEKYMPRIAQILRELDRRFREELSLYIKNDYSKIESLSIICNGNAYMANLSISASHKVNGVAEIHSQILKTRMFSCYSDMWPDKFTNVTNGISHVRWLAQSNPELHSLIVSLIGDGYLTHPEQLALLSDFESNTEVLDKIGKIKFNNKKRLAEYIKNTTNKIVDPNARFDIQIKRIHEYKRQLMFVMKIIYLINEIKSGRGDLVEKQVFIFSGKAASGYEMARRFIELISSVSKEIEEDSELSSKLQVIFLENYNVSLAEILMPATEVSEQISLAGREASGTGNMKAVLNGALMLCTIDGANIEICEKCGRENMFEFGLTASEVQKINSHGYNAMDYYSASEKIRGVLSKMNEGIGGEKYDDLVRYLLGTSHNRDIYMCLADFESYISAHNKMDIIYRNKHEWNKRCLHAISQMGYFSADRSIKEYAEKIWHLE